MEEVKRKRGRPRKYPEGTVKPAYVPTGGKRGRPRKNPEGTPKPAYVPTGGKRGRPRKSDNEKASVMFLAKPKNGTGKRGRPPKNRDMVYVIKKDKPYVKSRTATIVKIDSGNYDMSYLVGRKVRLKEKPTWMNDDLYYGVISSPGYEGVDMAFAHDEIELD